MNPDDEAAPGPSRPGIPEGIRWLDATEAWRRTIAGEPPPDDWPFTTPTRPVQIVYSTAETACGCPTLLYAGPIPCERCGTRPADTHGIDGWLCARCEDEADARHE